MSLREEILGEMIKADNNGSIHSSNYGILTEIILSLIEKRIDSRIQLVKDTNHWDDNENPANFCCCDCDEFGYYVVWMELEDIKKEMLK